MNKKSNAKKRKKGRVINLSVAVKTVMILAALTAVVFAVYFLINSGNNNKKSVIYNVTIEAGTEITPSMFVFGGSNTASFYEEVDCEKLSVTPGTHELKLLFEEQLYTVNLIVNDTIAPTGSVKPVIYKKGTVADPSVMVFNLKDVTDVNITFDHSPNMSVEGRQNVTVMLTDLGGNSTKINGTVYVTSDLKMPTWEMGSELPKPSDFTTSVKDAIFQNTDDFYSIKAPGKYYASIRVTIGGIVDSFYAPFEAIDTKAPIMIPKENYIYNINDKLPPATEMLSSVTEFSEYEIDYLEYYSIPEPGIYALTIKAVDIVGNESRVVVTVTAIDGNVDNGAPIITVSSEIKLTVGSNYDLSKYVTIFDDKDGDILLSDTSKVTINAENVNLMVPGSYKILVSAKDTSGKVANSTVTVIVSHIEMGKSNMEKALRDYLATIVTDGMTVEQKIKAVFDSLANNDKANFGGSSDKSNDDLREAYYGVTFLYGDSYTTACTIANLLDLLEIPNKTVERIEGKTVYFWNLVDFGDGWYHVDAAHHDKEWNVDGQNKQTYKLTDSEVNEYTSWYNHQFPGTNYYKFETSLYPNTPVKGDNGYEYLPYDVIYNTSEGGYIEGEAQQSVVHGNFTSTVKAVPAAGFKFVRWSDGVLTAERSDFITGNFTVTAEFTQQSSVITKNYIFNYQAGVGGRVDGILRQTVKSGMYGTEVIAIPEEGYRFAGWSDGVTTDRRTDIAKGNISVTAYFAPNDGSNFVLEYKASIGGAIVGHPIQVVTAGAKGSEVVAQADDEYMFIGWSDGVTTINRRDVSDKNISVIAYFVRKDSVIYSVNYTAGEGGFISGLASQKIEEGSVSITVTAVANRGYVFAGWSDGVTTSMRNDMITADVTFEAVFVKLNPVNVTYTVDGEGGYINGTAVQEIYPGEATIEVTAVANFGYKFVGWSDGVTEAVRSDLFTVDTTVIAIFAPLETFNITYTVTEGGSIAGVTVQDVFVGMEGTAVTAVALDGYRFVMWSDGVTDATRTDIANENKTIQAIFELLSTVTVTYVAGEGGSISGTLEQTAYVGVTFTPVTAVPAEGYVFVNWSDGVTTPDRMDTASENVKIVAIFAPAKVCTIYYTSTVGGVIQGESTQILVIGQTCTTVKAVATEGYKFVMWSDGVATAERTDVASSELMTITAIFALIDPA